jgi:hypothetical protein
VAEFLENNEKPIPVEYPPDSGFEAMGKQVPWHRRQAAYETLREIGVSSPAERFECVNGMAGQVLLDQPYEAMRIGMRYVDLTGVYRVLAVLCCG